MFDEVGELIFGGHGNQLLSALWTMAPPTHKTRVRSIAFSAGHNALELLAVLKHFDSAYLKSMSVAFSDVDVGGRDVHLPDAIAAIGPDRTELGILLSGGYITEPGQ